MRSHTSSGLRGRTLAMLGTMAIAAAAGILPGAEALIPLNAAPATAQTDDAIAMQSTAPVEDTRVLVSLDSKQLWLVNQRGDTLLQAPIAVGKSGAYELGGRVYTFQTPKGTRKVLSKSTDPNWIPPDWHYLEKAGLRGLDVVMLKRDEPVMLSDSTIIEVRGDQVGRINRYGNWWPFTPGYEIIFDGTMYVPPIGTEQREIPNALGPYKINLGEGYLIHGTHEYNEDSIGTAASHGCIRMRNEDVTRLFSMVSVGTEVEIF